MKIEGSTALVTGANRGIGKALAEGLLDRGAAKVYAGVRDVESVTDPRLVAVAVDVADPDRVSSLAAELSDVEIVVNNAGVLRATTPLEVKLEDARTELEVNYLGIVSMTKAFAPVLAANGGGAFVNVLSAVSWIGAPGMAGYAASKAAAWSYSNAARIELKRQGTQVVGVHVGFVDTDMVDAIEDAKVPPAAVADSAFRTLEEGGVEAIVDDLSRTYKAGLSDDQNLIYPGLEKRFEGAIR